MQIYHNKKHRGAVCVQIPYQPTIRYVSHYVFYTIKSKLDIGGIMMKVDDQDCSKSPLPEPNVQLSLH